MSDDVVDTIAQYDLDDDFPDYANEQNKELNQIVTISFLSIFLTICSCKIILSVSHDSWFELQMCIDSCLYRSEKKLDSLLN